MASRFARAVSSGAVGAALLAAAVWLLVATTSPAGAAAPGAPLPVIPRLHVTPASGGPSTVFTVHFDAREASGTSGGRMHAYALSAAPEHTGRGCIAAVEIAPHATTAGESLAVTLVPRRFGRRWCAGTYTGEVGETVGPGCGPISDGPAACPMYVVLERLGTFRFTVTG